MDKTEHSTHVNNAAFVGIGRNPDPDMPDIPMGLGMRIAENPAAMARFTASSKDEKRQIIGYVQGAQTGDDSLLRIKNAVDALASGTTIS